MSDNWIAFVAADPHATPPPAALEAARKIIEAALPRAEEIVVHRTRTPQLFDAGANVQAVRCPQCARELSVEWWQDAVDDAARSAFRQLDVVLECCGTHRSLNDLVYDWPQAFGRAAIDVMNPDVDEVPADLERRVDQPGEGDGRARPPRRSRNG